MENQEATARPWRVRVETEMPARPYGVHRLLIEGAYSPTASRHSHSYVVCSDAMVLRREQAQADYDLIVRAVNSHEALVEAARGVSIMLNTALEKYEAEPWAQRVRAALALVDSPRAEKDSEP